VSGVRAFFPDRAAAGLCRGLPQRTWGILRAPAAPATCCPAAGISRGSRVLDSSLSCRAGPPLAAGDVETRTTHVPARGRRRAALIRRPHCGARIHARRDEDLSQALPCATWVLPRTQVACRSLVLCRADSLRCPRAITHSRPPDPEAIERQGACRLPSAIWRRPSLMTSPDRYPDPITRKTLAVTIAASWTSLTGCSLGRRRRACPSATIATFPSVPVRDTFAAATARRRSRCPPCPRKIWPAFREDRRLNHAIQHGRDHPDRHRHSGPGLLRQNWPRARHQEASALAESGRSATLSSAFLHADARGPCPGSPLEGSRTTLSPAAAGSHPMHRLFGQALPCPSPTLRPLPSDPPPGPAMPVQSRHSPFAWPPCLLRKAAGPGERPQRKRGQRPGGFRETAAALPPGRPRHDRC